MGDLRMRSENSPVYNAIWPTSRSIRPNFFEMWLQLDRECRHHTSLSRVRRWSYSSNIWSATNILSAYDTSLRWDNYAPKMQLASKLESQYVPYAFFTLTLWIIGRLCSTKNWWSIWIQRKITICRICHDGARIRGDRQPQYLTHRRYLWTADLLGN